MGKEQSAYEAARRATAERLLKIGCEDELLSLALSGHRSAPLLLTEARDMIATAMDLWEDLS